jgi:putative PIN family toxin of toxin-antitoxin system
MVFKGNERKLLDAIIDKRLKLVVSDDVLKEAEMVFKKKFPKHGVLFSLFLQFVNCEKIPKKEYRRIEKQYSKLIRDKTDVPILAAAVASKCDYLVTGDKELLSMKKAGFTRIIRMWELLRELKKVLIV